jgi:uracil phosphoribosyltransferase
MSRDLQHQILDVKPNEVDHHYGQNVHILNSPLALSLLAKLGHPSTKQPVLTELLIKLYDHLLDYVVDRVFPVSQAVIESRMKEIKPTEGSYQGCIINPDTATVVVDLARAGTPPSQHCYLKLNYLMNPEKVRQDHFYIARVTNEKNQVTGVSVSGSKIGGRCDQAIVLFPDPMGATGGTMEKVYHHYKEVVGGQPLSMVAMHLIITPEYIKRVTRSCPDLKIYALRLDRGLSPQHVLDSTPGKFWAEEKGLTDHHYIVPGAGGVGEILNNSYC